MTASVAPEVVEAVGFPRRPRRRGKDPAGRERPTGRAVRRRFRRSFGASRKRRAWLGASASIGRRGAGTAGLSKGDKRDDREGAPTDARADRRYAWRPTS